MEWLAGGVIVWLLWHFVGRHAVNAAASEPTPSTVRRPSPTATFEWPPLGEYDFEVVGEGFCQPQLKAMVGDHGTDSAEMHTTAFLVPDDKNKHDDKAVRVDIGGYTVGHLSKNDARSFRKRLSAKKMSGATTSCKAVIMGGFTNRAGEKASYGVRLDINPFDN
ncbi:MAG: hypothetical protein KA777_01325 [Rhodoferax sp.]|nr:hypothetical protein [Rhodoferax sp.]